MATGTMTGILGHMREWMKRRAACDARARRQFSDLGARSTGNGVFDVANRVAMGRGLNGPRFLWVPLTTLDVAAHGESVSIRLTASLYAREADDPEEIHDAANLTSLPPTLDEYHRLK